MYNSNQIIRKSHFESIPICNFQSLQLKPQIRNNGNKSSHLEQISALDFTRLENTVDILLQMVNNFTNSIISMMQEMSKIQSILLQAVLAYTL